MRLAVRRFPRALAAAVLAALWLAATAMAQQAPPVEPLPPQQQPAAGPAQPQAAAPKQATAPKQSLPPGVTDTIDRLTSVMDSVEKSVARLKDAEEDLGRLRDELERIINQSTEAADRLRPRLGALKGQIDKLGPPPGKDAPPEAPAVAAERTRLVAESSAVDGAVKTLELTWYRARQMIDKITDLRLSMFTKSLMERMSSPLLPPLWREAIGDYPKISKLIRYLWTDWWTWASMKLGALSIIIIGALALYAGLRFGIERFIRTRRSMNGATLTFFERAATAAWVAVARAIPAVLAALVIYGGLDALDLLYHPGDRIGAATIRAVILFVCVASLIRAIFAPHAPERRLLPLADEPARLLTRNLQGMTAIASADLALTAINRALYMPLSLSVLQSFVISICFAALLIGVLTTPFTMQAEGGTRAVAPLYPRWLKLPLWVIAIAIIVVSILGYVALGRFVAYQIVMTGAVIMVASLLFLAIRAFTRETEDAHPVGHLLEERFGLDAPRRMQIAKLTEIALTLTLAILALPILLLLWGFSGADIRDWLKSAVFGFEIGHFKISLARILIGIVLFTALLFATRMFQRWMRDAVLVAPRVDPGIAHSIVTALGYLGIAIAAIVAVSYAGFDITSLAIVAGALSVGIGFGLQSIVNNFVSGLILLIERPIKVGDWIVVGNEQGNVRRISVRSTEIETFDRASLIVPNSELVTGRVLNWTHRNSLGRVIIRISAPYDADPAQVLAILKAASDHPMIARTPEPVAAFDNFGASGLEFSLRVVLVDITKQLAVQTDVRTAILKAFREADIGMPYPQHDIHLRDLDGLKRLAGEAIANQRAKAAAEAALQAAASAVRKSDPKPG